MRGGGAHLLPHHTGHGPREEGGGRWERTNIKRLVEISPPTSHISRYTVSLGTRPSHVEGLVPRPLHVEGLVPRPLHVEGLVLRLVHCLLVPAQQARTFCEQRDPWE